MLNSTPPPGTPELSKNNSKTTITVPTPPTSAVKRMSINSPNKTDNNSTADVNVTDSNSSSKINLTDVISESMVNTTPPTDCYVGPSSCALHLHTDGTLTILLNNLETNEKIVSFDFTSTILINSLETFSANGSMSSRSVK